MHSVFYPTENGHIINC